MPELQIRPTLPTDIPRLMGFDHSVTSESVWQLELRRDTAQSTATFREVRLPRSISVFYPRNPFALADDWQKHSMMYSALLDQNIAGYLCLLERGMDSVICITDLVVHTVHRRQGLAGALLNAAQDWAATRSHRRILLEMQSKNLPAIRLAQKFGYEFCGYNDQCYLTQDVALFFAKALK